jgi:hypothetical protein
LENKAARAAELRDLDCEERSKLLTELEVTLSTLLTPLQNCMQLKQL